MPLTWNQLLDFKLDHSSSWAKRANADELLKELNEESRIFTHLLARTLLGAKGIATRSTDATRGSWHCY